MEKKGMFGLSDLWLWCYFKERIKIWQIILLSLWISQFQYKYVSLVMMWLLQLRIWDDWQDRYLDQQLHQRDLMLKRFAGFFTLLIQIIVFLFSAMMLDGLQWQAYQLLLLSIFSWYHLRPNSMKYPLTKVVYLLKYPAMMLVLMLPIEQWSMGEWMFLQSILIATFIYEFKTDHLLEDTPLLFRSLLLVALMFVLSILYYIAFKKGIYNENIREYVQSFTLSI